MLLNPKNAGERALALHQGGLHCAEAVFLAVMEAADVHRDSLVPRAASCFGAGVGRTKEELCGALAGGLLAAGGLLGRHRIGESCDHAAEVAAELRERFLEAHGCTRCKDLLEALGPQENSHLCKRLSQDTAALVCETLNEMA